MSTKHEVVDGFSINHQLKANYLFRNSNISESDFDDLKLNIINLKTGEILFREGDSTNSIYLIVEGEINLIKKQSFGKTHLCVSENKFFGHEEYFLQSDRNSIAIALKDSCIVELSKENIEKFLSKDNSILNNVKNSFHDLDSESIIKFENVFKEWPGFVEKPSTVLPIEIKTIDDKISPQGLSDDIPFISDSKKLVYNKIDLNKIKYEIDTTINKFNKNLSLFEEEKDKMRTLISAYEDDNTKLLVEIEKLKEHEAELISLEKEKTEILGRQSYRIVELEEETEKFAEQETGYSKKIELLNEQVSVDKNRIQKLEMELNAKEIELSKFDHLKKTLADLNESQAALTQKTQDQEQVIKDQKGELKNSEKKIEELILELTTKEIALTELNKEFLNKNKLLSAQHDNANKVKAELEAKEDVIKSQTAKIDELKNNLNYQKESEKNKNEYILNQSNKIAECEDLLQINKQELIQKDETINNLIIKVNELDKKIQQNKLESNQQKNVIENLNANIDKVKDELSKSKGLIEELNTYKTGFIEKTNAYSELIKENNHLSEQIKSLKLQIQEEKNASINLASMNDDLNKLMAEFVEKNDAYNGLLKENTHLSEQIKSLELQIREEKNVNNNLTSINDELNKLKSEFEIKNGSYNELEKKNTHLSEQIKSLEFQIQEEKNVSNNLTSINDELNKLRSEFDLKNGAYNELLKKNTHLSEQIKSLELQIQEEKNVSNNLTSINDELNKLRSEFDVKNAAYNELLKKNTRLSEQVKSFELQIQEEKNTGNNQVNINDELHKLKSEFADKNDAYTKLINENTYLINQIKTLKVQIEESKNESNKLLNSNYELDKLRAQEEKYRSLIAERDNVIGKQKEQIESTRKANSEALKTDSLIKKNYADDLKNKNNQIAELKGKLKDIQITLDEKTIFENQQIETIDNQAQKIAELELLVNESRVQNNNDLITKDRDVLKVDSSSVDSGKLFKENKNDDIFSKCKLIKTKPVDPSFTDENFEHFQDLDIDIVNVNLTRATIDVVSTFNEFLTEVISKGKNKIIVNLSHSEFIDSSILGVLVSSLKKVTALGGDLRLVGFHPSVRSMLELTRLHRLFEYFLTIEEAIRSFD